MIIVIDISNQIIIIFTTKTPFGHYAIHESYRASPTVPTRKPAMTPTTAQQRKQKGTSTWSGTWYQQQTARRGWSVCLLGRGTGKNAYICLRQERVGLKKVTGISSNSIKTLCFRKMQQQQQYDRPSFLCLCPSNVIHLLAKGVINRLAKSISSHTSPNGSNRST